MNISLEPIAQVFAIGAGARLTMDLLNFAMVGRWVGQ